MLYIDIDTKSVDISQNKRISICSNRNIDSKLMTNRFNNSRLSLDYQPFSEFQSKNKDRYNMNESYHKVYNIFKSNKKKSII